MSTNLLPTKTNHSYYCSDSNWTDRDAYTEHESVTDFLDDMEEADIDYNFCFRYDIVAETDDNEDETGKLSAKFYFMQQRKGKFVPHICKSYDPETEGERLTAFLKRHYYYAQQLWVEFSKVPKTQE